MGKHKNIRFYDNEEMKFIYLPIEDVRNHFKEFVNVDYEDIDEYIAIHCISHKHKKAILKEN